MTGCPGAYQEADIRAHDIMTRNVISISPDATIQEAARLLADKHISGAPVLDEEGRLCAALHR